MPSASGAEPRPGRLVLVGTPIGNLGDITLRAIETLKNADLVVAEDTRRSRALLSHLGISKKPVERMDAHASPEALASVVQRLREGKCVALVTDAGMPSVSDPGAALVRAAIAANVEVSVVPGPSAVSAAAALSGLVESAYLFVGFLPRKGKKRRAALRRIAESVEPVVLFEAPGRTPALLAELSELAPERPATLCRELTKLHEQTLRGSLRELAEQAGELRGEVTLVLGPGPERDIEAPTQAELEERIAEMLSQGQSAKDIAGELSRESGLPRNAIYAKVLELKRD